MNQSAQALERSSYFSNAHTKSLILTQLNDITTIKQLSQRKVGKSQKDFVLAKNGYKTHQQSQDQHLPTKGVSHLARPASWAIIHEHEEKADKTLKSMYFQVIYFK
jgi:hypothetical protein